MVDKSLLTIGTDFVAILLVFLLTQSYDSDMFSKRKTIVDEAREFQEQYAVVKIIVFKYLVLWFEQIFSLPEWENLFKDKPDMHEVMAAEVERYLLGDGDDRNISKLSNKEEVEMAKKHAEKWADDCMERDPDFRGLVIQTLRMESVFQEFSNKSWLFNDPRGKRVKDIVLRYGGKVSSSPDPKKYRELFKKWMLWDKLVSEKLKEGKVLKYGKNES